MRNKKLIFVTTLMLTICVLLCAFVGCQKKEKPAEILMSFHKDEVKSTVKTVELTNLKDYTIMSNNRFGEVVVARKYDSDNEKYTYALVNIAENKVIATSDNVFSKEITGVYSTSKEVDEVTKYSFYDKKGVIKESVKEDEFDVVSARKITFTDGTVVINTKKSGVVVFEQTLENALHIANLEGEDVYESGNLLIIDPYDAYFYVIYDKDGNYKYSVNPKTLVNASASDNVEVRIFGKGKMAIQVMTSLTEVEAQKGFDYVVDDGYFNLKTYVYDLESKALAEVEFNNLFATGNESNEVMTSKDEDYALVYVNEIASKHVVEKNSLIAVDNDLNVKVKLDDLVKGAVYFATVDETAFMIIDDCYMAYLFNAQGEKINEFSAYGASMTRSGLYKAGRRFYDIKGNEVFALSKNMIYTDETARMDSDGLIYYMEENDNAGKIGIFDSKTGNTVTYDAEKFNSISTEIFTIRDNDDNITLYSIYDGKAISSKKFAYATSQTSGKYTIITAVDADDNVTYFSYIVE